MNEGVWLLCPLPSPPPPAGITTLVVCNSLIDCGEHGTVVNRLRQNDPTLGAHLDYRCDDSAAWRGGGWVDLILVGGTQLRPFRTSLLSHFFHILLIFSKTPIFMHFFAIFFCAVFQVFLLFIFCFCIYRDLFLYF